MHIYRDIEETLLAWKNCERRQPLILEGARQIGKTWEVLHFGENHFKHVAVFNFDRSASLASVFEKTKDINELMRELAYFSGVPFVPSETLIFFDEIQECPHALNALKYFEEDAPQFHVIAAGSLLGVALNRAGSGFPVGKVHFEKMFPITFKEFLRAADQRLYNLADECVKDKMPLPETLFTQLASYYKSYQLCGGMPRATATFISGLGTDAVETVLTDILRSFSADFNKYIDNKDVPRIHEIWKSIPPQLSRENRKFVFRTIRSGARAREYEAALDWLSLSGMTHKIYLSENPSLPLTFYENTTAFKIYLIDIALLRTLAGLPKEVVVTHGNLFKEFKGAMAENFVMHKGLNRRITGRLAETSRRWTSLFRINWRSFQSR